MADSRKRKLSGEEPEAIGEWIPYPNSVFMHNATLNLFHDPQSDVYFQNENDGTLAVVEFSPTTAREKLTKIDHDAKLGCQVLDPNIFPYFSESWTGKKDTNEDRVSNHALENFGMFFGLYDGHGGVECSDYLTEHLHQAFHSILLEKNHTGCFGTDGDTLIDSISHLKKSIVGFEVDNLQLKDLLKVSDGDVLAELTQTTKDLDVLLAGLADQLNKMETQLEEANTRNKKYNVLLERAMISSFSKTDTAFLRIAKNKHIRAGSTALVAFLHGLGLPYHTKLCVANTGDCRAVLSRGGTALPLSDDHKPDRKDEERRIKKAGGVVLNVNGVWRLTAGKNESGTCPGYLAVSRAFGDNGFKDPQLLVVCTPDVRTVDLVQEDAFVILACDGVWDVLSNQEAVDIASEHFANPIAAAAALVRSAFKKGSLDNITATVVMFPWASLPITKTPVLVPPVVENSVTLSHQESDIDIFS